MSRGVALGPCMRGEEEWSSWTRSRWVRTLSIVSSPLLARIESGERTIPCLSFILSREIDDDDEDGG